MPKTIPIEGTGLDLVRMTEDSFNFAALYSLLKNNPDFEPYFGALSIRTITKNADLNHIIGNKLLYLINDKDGPKSYMGQNLHAHGFQYLRSGFDLQNPLSNPSIEILYAIDKASRGKGLANKARMAMDNAIIEADIKVDTYTEVDIENQPSINTNAKLPEGYEEIEFLNKQIRRYYMRHASYAKRLQNFL